MNMGNDKCEQVWKSLRDPEFRKQLIDEHINVGIAFQIRSLRNRQDLKQTDLARKLNIKQPLVSAWENPNYGKYTLNTLKDLAKAFDVGLLVRFVPFSTLADWTVNVTSDRIAPPSFSEEEDDRERSNAQIEALVQSAFNTTEGSKSLEPSGPFDTVKPTWVSATKSTTQKEFALA